MREKNQETLADIIAEMRMGSPWGPCAYRIGLPDKEEVYESGARMRTIQIKDVTVKELADRLEAAAKREKVQLGNAAAMRETLCDIVMLTMKVGYSIHGDVACGIIASKAKHALSAPARQCDVGTAEEKYQRWVHFCEQRLHSCHNCECNSLVGCTFKFGDMPYIKEEGARK